MESFSNKRLASLLALGALASLLLYGCYRLLAPFLGALAWALSFAVVGSPIHRALASRVRMPNLTSAISVAVVAIILIIPALLASDQLLRHAALAVDFWTEHEPLERFPILNHIDIKGGLSELARQLLAVVKVSMGALAQLPIAMFCLFFFFRDRDKILAHAASWLPLSNEELGELTTRVSDILHATIFGRILLAFVQGSLGGLMFLWLGLPTPLLWGLIMSFLALVPFVGASLVWLPASIFLFLSGNTVKALLLGGWGLLVVSTIDNALYPFLVGSRMQLHPLATFLGVLGGIAWFGPSGLILGPVILASASALLEVCRKRFDTPLGEEARLTAPALEAPPESASPNPTALSQQDPPLPESGSPGP